MPSKPTSMDDYRLEACATMISDLSRGIQEITRKVEALCEELSERDQPKLTLVHREGDDIA